MAYRISEPLRALGNDLAKVGQFHLAPAKDAAFCGSRGQPTSRCRRSDEIGAALVYQVCARTISFAGFSPAEKKRFLEANSGGLPIFFSDIEGFTIS